MGNIAVLESERGTFQKTSQDSLHQVSLEGLNNHRESEIRKHNDGEKRRKESEENVEENPVPENTISKLSNALLFGFCDCLLLGRSKERH